MLEIKKIFVTLKPKGKKKHNFVIILVVLTSIFPLYLSLFLLCYFQVHHFHIFVSLTIFLHLHFRVIHILGLLLKIFIPEKIIIL